MRLCLRPALPRVVDGTPIQNEIELERRFDPER
jgi:hypothetical protein